MKEPVFGSNKTQSYIEFETTQGKLRLGKEGLKVFIELAGVKTYITEDDGSLDVGSSDIGANATPVVRTNNPIVGANKPNTNIDVLDAAIGADASPAGTRTAGTIAVANTVNQNIDALDSAIGFEAQISGTPNVITKSGTIFQMLDQLDAKKSTQTIKKTIGGIGVAGCDFNFVTAADQVEQVIDLGAIIPARARVVDIFAVTENEFTGAISLAAEIGNSSSGAQFIASATIFAAAAVLAANLATLNVAPNAAASNVYVAATPGANWSLVTAGKVTIYIIINNVANN